MNKLVSICMPVYNSAGTIKEALQTALAQTYPNIEVIVVDNRSTDGTPDVVRGVRDDRIRLIENITNIGMVGNWNKALMSAKGDYVLMLHGDDRLYPDSIEKKVRLMERYKGVSIVISASRVINGRGEVIMERHPFRCNRIFDGKKFAMYSYLTKNVYGEPSNILFRPQAALKLGGFVGEIAYAADWDLWLRMSCIGKVGYVDEVLMDYRISQTNATSKTHTVRMLEDDAAMTDNIEKQGLMKLNRRDKIIHRVKVVSRTVVRGIYIRIKTLGE